MIINARLRVKKILMKKIENRKKEKIISLLNSGKAATVFSKELKVYSRTVRRIRNMEMPDTPKGKGGRPTKLTKPTKRFIIRLVLTGKADTATQVANQLKTESNLDVSPDTVRRALKQSGLRAVTKKKKLLLLPRHKKARFEFAKKFEGWTVEDWKRVIWADEHKINRLGSDGRQWMWKMRGSGLSDQQVKGTVKFGGGNLMIWGCMTSQGVGYACRIEGTMDTELYVSILNDELCETMEYYGMERGEIIFQQDNDPKHKSRLATQWFEDNEMTVL